MKLSALRTPLAPDLLVRRMVNRHRKNAPESKMQMAIWLNAGSDPLYPWQHGVDLLEIEEDIGADAKPEFRATEFAPRDDWPRLRLTLAHPDEFATPLGQPYLRRLVSRLASGKAKIVYMQPRLNNENLLKLRTAADKA